MSSPAVGPDAGFLKTHPALGQPMGCFRRRAFMISLADLFIFTGS
jgi:hypothetical protein